MSCRVTEPPVLPSPLGLRRLGAVVYLLAIHALLAVLVLEIRVHELFGFGLELGVDIFFAIFGCFIVIVVVVDAFIRSSSSANTRSRPRSHALAIDRELPSLILPRRRRPQHSRRRRWWFGLIRETHERLGRPAPFWRAQVKLRLFQDTRVEQLQVVFLVVEAELIGIKRSDRDPLRGP